MPTLRSPVLVIARGGTFAFAAATCQRRQLPEMSRLRERERRGERDRHECPDPSFTRRD